MSRTSKSIRNIIVALIGQGLALLISFFTRRVFVSILSAEYLGLDGLFANILNMLSLAELGVGASITFSLYKPLAEEDTPKIKSLMRLYRKAYTLIGIVVGLVGLAITPLLPNIIKDVPDIPHINLIYILFVGNSSLSYFFTYKRSLIIADQKRYIATFYRYGIFIALNIAQITILLATRNYILYLALLLLSTITENILISRKANTLYPYLKEANCEPLDKDTKRTISKNVRAMMSHKIGGIVVLGTDNVLIARLIGIASVGLYSNYLLITNALNTIYSLLFHSITASIGNLGAIGDRKRLIEVFHNTFFATAWIYGFSLSCLVSLFNPVIRVWLGEAYLFPLPTVCVIALNFYFTGMRKGVLTFREALGLYWYDRYKPIVESAINLGVSIWLGLELGVAGIFLGTIISTLTTCFWVEPYVLYKYGLKSRVSKYFFKYAIYSVSAFLATLITYWACSFVQGAGFGAVALKCLICLLIPNTLFIALSFWTKEFRYFMGLVKSLIGKALHRVKA